MKPRIDAPKPIDWQRHSIGVAAIVLGILALASRFLLGLSDVGAVWAMGDFAVSRIISGSDMTLAMWTQSLVDQYRWDMALVLSWIILAASFIVFGFFWSLSYVSHKKLSEDL